jgi:RimJ/RimL family protein N-acetyltransferase
MEMNNGADLRAVCGCFHRNQQREHIDSHLGKVQLWAIPLDSFVLVRGQHCQVHLNHALDRKADGPLSQDMADLTNLQTPFVIGERVYLRPLEPSQDNHLFATWLCDQEIRRYFSVYPTSSLRGRERLETFYKGFSHILLGVALKNDNCLIGLVGLNDINTLNQSAEFYVIIGDRSVWGQGYGTEATKLMLRYGFLELNLNRIQTTDMEENVGGWRADEKAGFKLEGIMRENIQRFGKYHDQRLYSMLRREFLEKEQE